MAREDAAPLLKDFVPVKVDTDRMTGGKDVLASYPRAKNQGIPWFVFLDPEGKELGDSIGPKGNIGCPNTDEEIDAFLAILRRVAKSLGEEDFVALKKSLLAHREKK
jgi:hypothetical protein